jgi:anthranilate phosphoribosyltransferase
LRALPLGPEGVAQCVQEVGMGFMYAPRYHPSMAAVGPVRKALKVRTAFNLLGPMLNPARSKYALVRTAPRWLMSCTYKG